MLCQAATIEELLWYFIGIWLLYFNFSNKLIEDYKNNHSIWVIHGLWFPWFHIHLALWSLSLNFLLTLTSSATLAHISVFSLYIFLPSYFLTSSSILWIKSLGPNLSNIILWRAEFSSNTAIKFSSAYLTCCLANSYEVLYF